MIELKVSVCIVTYNHIQYIRQCLDSLVNQETNFPFEILISDDCSIDGTKEILQTYIDRFPSIVKVFFQEKNLGAQDNFIFIHQQAKSKYVAHIDGDDYALPGKLQAQANYLDQNPNCNIVWHRMKTLKNDQFYNDNFVSIGLVYKKIMIHELIANVTIGLNSSKMYRREFKHNDWIKYYDLDFSFNVLKLADTTKYAAFTEDLVLGVYRSSIGVSLTQNYKIKVKIYKCLVMFYKDEITERPIINAKILLLLLSDIKHLKKTMFYGFYAFIITIINFRVKSLIFVNRKKENVMIMATLIDDRI